MLSTIDVEARLPLVCEVPPSARQVLDDVVGEHEEIQGEAVHIEVLVGEWHVPSYRRERTRERERERETQECCSG